MAVIAIRKNAYDAASNAQRQILKLAMAKLQLGTPVTYTGQGQEWYVFSDSRVTLKHVAVLGKLVKGLASLPRNWSPPMTQDDEGNDVRVDRKAVEAQVYDFVKANVVLPRDVEYDETVTIQAPDREWRTFTDPDTGEEYSLWVKTGTTSPIQVVQPKANPWQVTLDAQAAPGAIKAADAVPASWEAVTDGE